MAYSKEKTKLIIDCDAGVDDAMGILVALAQPSVELLAITCVAGNVGLEQVCVNVLKILEFCERTDIPVYKGASLALLGQEEIRASDVHGEDGLGDVQGIRNPDMSLLKAEHAANTLIKLANENAGDITLVAIGPLTNVALACRLEPKFSSRLKNIVIMGGNIRAQGNAGISCEFNFHQDPEAAHVVLSELECPVSIVTLEVCRKHAFDWEFYEMYTNLGTKKANFVKKITGCYSSFRLKKANYVTLGLKFQTYDELAMAVAIRPDIVLREGRVFATVELHGYFTRGQMVVDWQNKLNKKCNVTLVYQIDTEELKQLILDSVQ